MRQPWNVFVYLFREIDNGYKFLLLKRRDSGVWQGIAGGGEDNETLIKAAIRETNEEAGIVSRIDLLNLDTKSYIQKTIFEDYEKWGENVFVVPLNYYAAEYNGDITISDEHTEYGWFDYNEAMDKLYWHDNKTALWELNKRINNR